MLYVLPIPNHRFSHPKPIDTYGTQNYVFPPAAPIISTFCLHFILYEEKKRCVNIIHKAYKYIDTQMINGAK